MLLLSLNFIGTLEVFFFFNVSVECLHEDILVVIFSYRWKHARGTEDANVA